MKDNKKNPNFLLSIISSLGNITKGKSSFKKSFKEKEIKLKSNKFATYIFFKSVFSVLVLTLYYLLLQNINTSTGNIYSNSHLNNRHSRILYQDIPSFLKGSKVNIAFEGQKKNPFSFKHDDNNSSSGNVDKQNDDLKKNFSNDNQLKNNTGKPGEYNKNEIMFSCANTGKCEEITEEELNDKLNNIKGAVNTKTMHLVWKYVHNHERVNFIRMQQETQNYCKLLAKHYNIPKEFETKKCKHVDDKITNALLKKERFDLKNIKEFAKEDICARWEFLRYINLKRRSWKELRESTKEKWANYINDLFKNYKAKK
ncbi:phist protein (Pf-fam-b) [Plasmodium vivax India VII]|uniref:Phist protein (Pf-fam-b) n=6 Tax=Plasmodium vivax TaxID=5855 RepID=A5KDR9_PLAVS|nr:Phist protein (Pf-fam-b) [Plasmodium vivax]KMZ81593.1 phist protein (Pf-fam-b) [Plasmodium vivax India VII]KMZ87810.1 phist protein (Pf-fam-b) [Plasmodium vivax Brazil I]KMZ94071.1 phist protein (Pf-fam-b) [Plasmodium vivax Mauritania I]KNA00621.1 phist protein (Pf-fam-b) [Plasmodium vivax North Korean]EDL42365.1 Phist protein (Pf-fam-b) [Plasmodium vivax]|eukprot:XP_001608389.1 Phist protein (Pf-fam-b) [Plasmodium vivax Sal-1]